MIKTHLNTRTNAVNVLSIIMLYILKSDRSIVHGLARLCLK